MAIKIKLLGVEEMCCASDALLFLILFCSKSILVISAKIAILHKIVIMDDETKISDLAHQVKDFCKSRDWDQFHNPKELAIGISSEAGELLQLFRFKSEAQIAEMFASEKQREKICGELADVFFFVLRFAQMNNIDLSEELLKKIEQNEQKYPVEKSKGSNKKYDEL